MGLPAPPPPARNHLSPPESGVGVGGAVESHQEGICLPRPARSLGSRIPENKETAHNTPHLLPQLLFPARSQSFLLAESPSPSFPGAAPRVPGELLAVLGFAGRFLWGGGEESGAGAPRAAEAQGHCLRGRDGLSPALQREERKRQSRQEEEAEPSQPEPTPWRAVCLLLSLSCVYVFSFWNRRALPTVSNFRLVIPTPPRNERRKNNTCLPEKAPGEKKRERGKKKKSKKRDLEEMSSRLSCQQTTTLPRSSAQRFSHPPGDGQTDAPTAPPTPTPPPTPCSSLLHL